jgi:hypothetical protein
MINFKNYLKRVESPENLLKPSVQPGDGQSITDIPEGIVGTAAKVVASPVVATVKAVDKFIAKPIANRLDKRERDYENKRNK